MTILRVVLTAISAASVLAVIGCSSARTAPEVATAPMAVPVAQPEPVVAADAMPSHPALQNERTVEVAMSNEPPAGMTTEPAAAAPAAEFIERAPQADRN